jgi:hypothetical protein
LKIVDRVSFLIGKELVEIAQGVDIIWDDAVKAEFVKSLEEARTELAKVEGSVGKAFG